MLGSGAVRPMHGRPLNAGPAAHCRAARFRAVPPNAKPCAHCNAVCSEQSHLLNAGLLAQCRTLRSMNAARPMQGHMLISRPCALWQRAPSRAVCSMQSRAINAGPNAQCRAVRRAVRSMRGRTECRAVRTTRGRKLKCRAARSMQSRTLNAETHDQCRAARTLQGRLPNARPHAPCKAVCSMQGRLPNPGTYDASPCAQ